MATRSRSLKTVATVATTPVTTPDVSIIAVADVVANPYTGVVATTPVTTPDVSIIAVADVVANPYTGVVAFRDAVGTFDVAIPTHVTAMAAAFATVTRDTAVGTVADPAATFALADAFRASLATVPGFNANPARVGTVSGVSVFGHAIGDTQTDIAIAATFAGVFAPRTATRADIVRTERIIMAMWLAVLTVGDRNGASWRNGTRAYGWSTTRDIIVSCKHPGSATFAAGVRAARAIAFPAA